jgi:hypothetical protein
MNVSGIRDDEMDRKKYRKSIETSRLPIDQVADIVMETGQMQTNIYINFMFC